MLFGIFAAEFLCSRSLLAKYAYHAWKLFLRLIVTARSTAGNYDPADTRRPGAAGRRLKDGCIGFQLMGASDGVMSLWSPSSVFFVRDTGLNTICENNLFGVPYTRRIKGCMQDDNFVITLCSRTLPPFSRTDYSVPTSCSTNILQLLQNPKIKQ